MLVASTPTAFTTLIATCRQAVAMCCGGARVCGCR